MLLLCWLCSGCLISFVASQPQYNMKKTDGVSGDSLSYHCFDSRGWVFNGEYCVRSPLIDDDLQSGSVVSNHTFVELAEKNVSAHDLLSWSGPINLVERYVHFLYNRINSSTSKEIFNRCHQLWFGPLCQYSFALNCSFREIFELTATKFNRHPADASPSTVTNGTCYEHIYCNRGPAPMCLDWREVCDGKVDCLNGGVDEKECFELESNTCGPGEFQCRNGMCIESNFVGDKDAECLDGTDEREDIRTVCGTMWRARFPFCEDLSPWMPSKFACGTGTDLPTFEMSNWARCENERDHIHWMSLHRETHDDVGCLPFVACAQMFDKGKCENVCNSTTHCSTLLSQRCPPEFLFPQEPVWEDHIRFGWQSGINSLEQPQFLCYEKERCPFLQSTTTIGNYSCLAVGGASLSALFATFHTCLPLLLIGNDTHCRDATMFHCPKSTKCIPTRRLLDGIMDCPDGADEFYADSCLLSDAKYRFPCTSEKKCIPVRLVKDGTPQCRLGEDEEEQIPLGKLLFSSICNGKLDITKEAVIRANNESDESNCGTWPCVNQYTRCDGVWNCRNGADELNCSSSHCGPNQHECMSLQTHQMTCLSVDLVGDNVTISSLCSLNNSLIRSPQFSHHSSPQYPPDFPTPSNKKALKNSTIQKSSDLLRVDTSPIDSKRAWYCNYGLLMYAGVNKRERCLCPPAYYGDRCQYQSQRISFTVSCQVERVLSTFELLAFVAMLIEEDNGHIHSYEEITYIPAQNCNSKLHTTYHYKKRLKDTGKKYALRIDAYEQQTFAFRASWLFKIKFSFLPVQRMSAHIIVPHQLPPLCSKSCGLHGRCVKTVNEAEEICYCEAGWSGVLCNEQHDCSLCSPSSRCIGIYENRSMCLCPVTKYGPRCLLDTVCVTCKNNGLCVPGFKVEMRKSDVCVCPDGFSGDSCQIKDVKIDIFFKTMTVPQSVLAHFILVDPENDPKSVTLFKKISIDQQSVSFTMSVPFHLIFIEIDRTFYLTLLIHHHEPSISIITEVKLTHRCPHVREILGNNHASSPFFQRVKYYHEACIKNTDLSCFHDQDTYICLCTKDRQANCVHFDFNKTYDCSGWNECENGAQCFQNLPTCPTKTMCVCLECFYGSRCQFNTKGYGLSLDAILGYHIRPHLPVTRQSSTVKVSLALTTIMFALGLISGFLSTLTFRSTNAREVGCGYYLFVLSIDSLLTMVVFTIKFYFLLFSQMSVITGQTALLFNCVTTELLLRVLPAIGDWLNTCVAFERTLTVVKGANFDKKTSKTAAKWVILLVIVLTIASCIHDPISRRLIDDQEEGRTWCVVQYSATLTYYNSAMNIIHFLVPFFVNFISTIIIISVAARRRSTAKKQSTFKQHLKQQFVHHKHLLISPVVLVMLALPRLIIIFISGCMKSARNPWLFLAGYFVSFIPSLLTFIVYILPSEMYMSEFKAEFKRLRTASQGFFYRN